MKSWLIGKDSDAGRDWGQEEKGMTEDEIAGWHHQLDGHECEWTPGDGNGQGGLECCDSWGRKESDTTERLNWTDIMSYILILKKKLLFSLQSYGIWSKLERWKSLISRCLMSWLKIKKIVLLKCHLLLLYTTMDHFSIGLWRTRKSGFYMTSDDQLSGWTEKKLQSTSQSQIWPKKKRL